MLADWSAHAELLRYKHEVKFNLILLSRTSCREVGTISLTVYCVKDLMKDGPDQLITTTSHPC